MGKNWILNIRHGNGEGEIEQDKNKFHICQVEIKNHFAKKSLNFRHVKTMWLSWIKECIGIVLLILEQRLAENFN